MTSIAVLGGTGPEGLGLAYRFAQIGMKVVVGSRDASRAAAAAQRVANGVVGAQVRGLENDAAAAAAEIVVLAFPYAAAEPYLASNATHALGGKIVVDVMVPLRFVAGRCVGVPIEEGSLGERVQRLAPQARVVSAFKNLSAEHLQRIEQPLEGDVLVCGDDGGAKREVSRLAERIANLRAVDAGPLSGARALEQITVMLLNINRIHRAVTSIRILGLETGG